MTRRARRFSWRRVGGAMTVSLGLIALVLTWSGCQMFSMPGESFKDEPPALDEGQRALRQSLEDDVRHLSETIGARHVGRPEPLHQAAAYIEQRLSEIGYAVDRQTYNVEDVTCANLIAEIPGSAKPKQIVVIGAHYDSVPSGPGANDNASGVAALLALAECAAGMRPDRTLRFIFFVNEEPPWFQTKQMGSYVYAKRCHEHGENITAMIALDGLGYYTDRPNTQDYPLPFLKSMYPAKGDFIALVSNWSSRELLYETVRGFRKRATIPSEGAAVPAGVEGAGFSDHWSFWQFDYPGVLVTDTLPFRYPQYHTSEDRIEHIDFEAMVRVIAGLAAAMEQRAGI